MDFQGKIAVPETRYAATTKLKCNAVDGLFTKLSIFTGVPAAFCERGRPGQILGGV